MCKRIIEWSYVNIADTNPYIESPLQSMLHIKFEHNFFKLQDQIFMPN